MTNATTNHENRNPTHVVRLIRDEKGRNSFPVKVGVTFTTKQGNLRLTWDVLPATSELANGILILAPYEDQSEASVE